MGYKNGLSIVICTRNRSDDLLKCIQSISRQNLKNISDEYNFETIIIDDGELSNEFILELKDILKTNMALKYNKKETAGLLLSRIKSLELSTCDKILFLDDDVVLEDINYISKLLYSFMEYPKAVGIGGIDQSIHSSKSWSKFTRLIGYDSGNVGKLSISSYGGSMSRWKEMNTVFETEFLHGCNMAFKRESLRKLKIVDWLSSYSLGEDIFLSQIALQSGILLVDPNLKVQHYHSATARDKLQSVAATEIINHHYLLKNINAGIFRQLAHIYTSLGLLTYSILRRNGKTIGYFKGISKTVKLLITGK